MKEIVEQVGIQCLKCPNKLFLLHLNAYFSCADFTDTPIFVFSPPYTWRRYIRLLTHTHTHSLSDLFSIPKSSPQRERLSQEQCKLGKMFRKVAFPTGTSQLELWVSTLSLCMCSLVRVCVTVLALAFVGVKMQIAPHVPACMKMWTSGWECVCSSLFLSGRRWLQTGVKILGRLETENKSMFIKQGDGENWGYISEIAPINCYKRSVSC